MEPLTKSADKCFAGPLVLVIMDGVGIGKYDEGDAVKSALTPHLDWLRDNAISFQLQAHGKAVGLPSDDDMGNSEVGHNAIGCGRVYEQGACLVNDAIESGALFNGEVWRDLAGNCMANGSTLHFIGLFSDGYVHSHIDHLKAMLERAKADGVCKARVHILLDGRDVPETSALKYVDPFEEYLTSLACDSFDCRIASGGGRMKVTMDRYDADWTIVERGWNTHVRGKGPGFGSAHEAIESLRSANPGVIDQDLPPFVIHEKGSPVGPVQDNDSVIFFNFRGDRAIEITRAFEDADLDRFDRSPIPSVKYAGMMQYDGDLMIPKRYLVSPPAIDRTVGEYLAASGVRQLAVSETQKFGHVTYFFNGNRSGKFDENLEEYIEIPSDIIPFEQRPWMKAAEITDSILEAIESGKHDFIRLNLANGDMVGHTGIYQAVEIAVEAVDLCLGRIINAVEAAGGMLLVSADHGNSDDMFERNKLTGEIITDTETGKPASKTSHSLNPVPFYAYDSSGRDFFELSNHEKLGVSSLGATCILLLGFAPPDGYDPSILKLKG